MNGTAAILRDVYGRHAAKKIALQFGVTVAAARVWLAGRFPEHRTKELVAVVRQELERIDARNNEIRKHLGIGIGGDALTNTGNEVVGRIDIESALEARQTADGLGWEVADT